MYYVIRRLPNEDPYIIVAGPMSKQEAIDHSLNGMYGQFGGWLGILYIPVGMAAL